MFHLESIQDLLIEFISTQKKNKTKSPSLILLIKIIIIKIHINYRNKNRFNRKCFKKIKFSFVYTELNENLLNKFEIDNFLLYVF